MIEQNQKICESKVNAKTRIRKKKSTQSAQSAWSAFWGDQTEIAQTISEH